MDSAPSQRPATSSGVAHPDGSALADGSDAKLSCSLSTGIAAARAAASLVFRRFHMREGGLCQVLFGGLKFNLMLTENRSSP